MMTDGEDTRREKEKEKEEEKYVEFSPVSALSASHIDECESDSQSTGRLLFALSLSLSLSALFFSLLSLALPFVVNLVTFSSTGVTEFPLSLGVQCGEFLPRSHGESTRIADEDAIQIPR